MVVGFQWDRQMASDLCIPNFDFDLELQRRFASPGPFIETAMQQHEPIGRRLESRRAGVHDACDNASVLTLYVA